jgi:DNA-binding transcriptional LysR family regulator
MAKVDLNDLRLLLKVVDHGGFTAATAATGVPVSTVSRRIACLEISAGRVLLTRTTRRLALTETGDAVLKHVRAIEKAARQAKQLLRPELQRRRRLAHS